MTSDISRRRFLKAGMALSSGLLAIPYWTKGQSLSENQLLTVQGYVTPESIDVTLPHEHILVDFIGADQANPERYNADEVFEVVLPHLKELKQAGCQTLMECTPAYLGRDPKLLKRLSDASSLNILTNTGYYGANKDKHLPPHAYSESAEQLARRWINEFEQGIDGTGIKPGFIKIGTDAGNLSAVDAKLAKAAAITHQHTGLTIASHTGIAPGAFEQLDILEQEGVDPSAWIWVHAQNEKDLTLHLMAAKKGAWVELDGYRKGKEEDYYQMIQNLKQNNLLQRVLISQDAGWYHVGEANGGNFRPFHPLFTDLLPYLKNKGITREEITQLIVTNPREAFTIRVRKSA